jgi:hypothetical protein
MVLFIDYLFFVFKIFPIFIPGLVGGKYCWLVYGDPRGMAFAYFIQWLFLELPIGLIFVVISKWIIAQPPDPSQE